MRKIAIFLPNWIGDVVMATPALRAVRETYPQAAILGVMRPYVSEVIAGLDLVDREIFCEQKDRTITRRLRRERIDAALLLTNSLRTAWLAWRAGAKQRIGLNRDGRRLLLTHPVRGGNKKIPHPAMENYLAVANAAGCDVSSRATELAVSPVDERRLAEFWEKHPHVDRDRVVCFNPGGAFGAAKHWPSEHFATLAKKVVSETNRTVLVLCGPAERETAREIVERANDPHVVSAAEEQLSIGLTKAAVASSELLVTTDSGPRHFAGPFGVPAITIFGPTHIAWSETFHKNATHLQREMPCGPCQKRVCPLGHHRCMKDLEPDLVWNALARALPQREAA